MFSSAQASSNDPSGDDGTACRVRNYKSDRIGRTRLDRPATTPSPISKSEMSRRKGSREMRRVETRFYPFHGDSKCSDNYDYHRCILRRRVSDSEGNKVGSFRGWDEDSSSTNSVIPGRSTMTSGRRSR